MSPRNTFTWCALLHRRWSGIAEGSGRSYAGVGFLVAPWAIKSIISFRGINDRLASLRVKQSGGVLTVLPTYAPHNGHTLEDRLLFPHHYQKTLA